MNLGSWKINYYVDSSPQSGSLLVLISSVFQNFISSLLTFKILFNCNQLDSFFHFVILVYNSVHFIYLGQSLHFSFGGPIIVLCSNVNIEWPRRPYNLPMGMQIKLTGSYVAPGSSSVNSFFLIPALHSLRGKNRKVLHEMSLSPRDVETQSLDPQTKISSCLCFSWTLVMRLCFLFLFFLETKPKWDPDKQYLMTV